MERGGQSEAHLAWFPYHDEYYTHMLMKEDERYQRFQYKARSPQLKYRKNLIKDLKSLSSKLGLVNTTYHLAVHLLDIFMDHHQIDTEQLILKHLALGIEAKYVDVDMNVPRISHLQALTNFNNTVHEFKTMELMLLNFWRWDLNFATSVQFLEHFLSGELLLRCADGLNPLHPHAFNDFKIEAQRLADLTLHEVHFIYDKSSLVAAACLAATRAVFRLLPTWPAALEAMTGYSYVDIDDCVQRLMHVVAQHDSSLLHQNPAVLIQPATVCDESKLDGKWKRKAPENGYNCARNKRRQVISRTDLKQLYCAM